MRDKYDEDNNINKDRRCNNNEISRGYDNIKSFIINRNRSREGITDYYVY